MKFKMQPEYFKCVFIIIFLFSKNDVKNQLKAYFRRKATGSKGPVAREQLIIPATKHVNKTVNKNIN